MNKKLTSIIILTKNNIQFTERCILSIIAHTDAKITPYEIILLDDGSIDGTKELAELYRNQVRFYDSTKYTKFGSKNNYGASLANGEYLWCLNNDVELLNNNLGPMLTSLQSKEIGAVGSLHLFPNGRVNHVGIVFNDKLHPEHLYPHTDANDRRITKSRYIDVVTGASLLIKKSTFDLVGGFDENYSWGYEDVDLCLKLKEKGFKNFCNTDAKMIHFGQSTRKDYTDLDLQNDANFQYFLSKWSNKIKSNYKDYPAPKNRKTYSPKEEGTVYPNFDANARVFLYKPKNFSAFALLSEKIEKHIDEPYEKITDLSLLNKTQGKKYLLSTTHFYPEYLQAAPGNFTELRTFDVNYERTSYNGNDYWTESIKRNNKLILASSNYCKEFLTKSGVPDERIKVVAHGYNDELLNFDFGIQDFNTINILMIINTNDPIRYGYEKVVRALEILKSENAEKLGRINLILKNYGSKESAKGFVKTELPILDKIGIKYEYIDTFISEENLAKLYYRANLFIAPFRGEGFGMKILDAAVAGLPIISPFYGGPKDYLRDAEHLPVEYKLIEIHEGIDYFSLFLNETYVWADVNENDLSKKISYAIENIEKLFNSALKKRDYLRENFSYKAKWEKIKEIINQIDEKEKENKFELYDAEIAVELTTKVYDAIKEFKQSYIINTNKPNNFRETLDHLKQVYDVEFFKDIEILIVDDASDQDVADLIKDYQDLPIKYIKYTNWGGSGFAREVGMRHSAADNIIISGDDIKPMKGFFEKHYQFCLDTPEKYLLIGHVEWDKGIRNNLIANFSTKVSSFQFGFEEIRNKKEIDFRHCYTPNVSFRKSDIVDSEVHFKTGMILFEDAIWGEEAMEKGFKIFYDRTLYALHNHKFKTDMLQWFIDRTTEIGNYTLISYALNSRFNEFLGIESLLPRLYDIYSKYPTDELTKLSEVFDETVNNVILSLRNLEKFDLENGYLKDVRDAYNEQITGLHVLYRIFGIAKNMNTSNPEEIAKGISFIYYQGYLTDKKDREIQMIGMKESLRSFIFFGRQRLPIVFEPLYQGGKIFKKYFRFIFKN